MAPNDCYSNRTTTLQEAVREASIETNHQLRDFLVHLQNGHTRLENLVDSRSGEIVASVKNENKETRIQIKSHHDDVTRQLVDGFQETHVHVDSSLNTHRINQLATEELKRFMQSLTYPEMNDRQRSDAINRTHEHTFEWILKEGDIRESSLREWLKSEDKIYWIAGKPASGKSNLMRTITTNSKTKQYLQTWRPEAKVVCAYIWLAGAATQRSQEGLLASILHQLLLNNPQAKESLYRTLVPFSKQFFSDWSLREMEDCLHHILRFDDSGVCIFIDGLDEINPDAAGGKHGLVRLLERILSNSSIKICVASREENVFRGQYGEGPKLRLQDLNRPDIAKYVSDSLECLEPDSSIGLTASNLVDLGELVTQRASGVFLWASVVVNTIIRAYQNRDEFQDIHKRIDQLPRDIENLYEETWNRINSDDKINYKAKSALYFRLVLESQDLEVGLLRALICANPRFAEAMFTGRAKGVDAEFFDQALRNFEGQIHARCAGLLQISSPEKPDPWEPLPGPLEEKRTITFVHRSAVDWFRDSLSGQSILRHEKRSVEELRFRAGLGDVPKWLFPTYDILDLADNYFNPNILMARNAVRQQLEASLLEFLASMLKRSPLGDFLKADPFYLVEIACWNGSVTYVRKYIDSIRDQSHERRTTSQNAILAWLGCRLWDLARPLDELENELNEDDWIEVLDLMSTMISNYSDLDLFHSPTGLRYQYDRNAIIQTPIISFLLAFNLCLEKNCEMSPRLQAAFLSVMSEFLKHDQLLKRRVTVNIGDQSRLEVDFTRVDTYKSLGLGFCWTRYRAIDWGSTSNVFQNLVQSEMAVPHIFRYSHSKLLNLGSFQALSQEDKSRIEAFLAVKDKLGNGKLYKFIKYGERDLSYSSIERYLDSSYTNTYSIELDSDLLELGIRLAEAGIETLFGALYSPLPDDLQKSHVKLLDVLKPQKLTFVGNVDFQGPISWGRDIQKWPEAGPIEFQDIDWSGKPEWAVLDSAIKTAFSSASAS